MPVAASNTIIGRLARIFGQSARSRWDLVMHGSIVDRFLRDVRDATVQIVPVRSDADTEDDSPGG